MINPIRRAACAIMLAGAALPAGAQESALHPAIATGLAIPVRSAIPSAAVPATGRVVIVDAASARLYMVENGQVRDSMRVIVGKPDSATPVLKSTLHYATLNPYWNVPTDLARKLIAPRVVAEGIGYLNERGYEIVSAFTSEARILDPQILIGGRWRRAERPSMSGSGPVPPTQWAG